MKTSFSLLRFLLFLCMSLLIQNYAWPQTVDSRIHALQGTHSFNTHPDCVPSFMPCMITSIELEQQAHADLLSNWSRRASLSYNGKTEVLHVEWIADKKEEIPQTVGTAKFTLGKEMTSLLVKGVKEITIPADQNCKINSKKKDQKFICETNLKVIIKR